MCRRLLPSAVFLFFTPPPPTYIYTLSLHDALPISLLSAEPRIWYNPELRSTLFLVPGLIAYILMITAVISTALSIVKEDRKSTRLNSSHTVISYAVFCLKKKKELKHRIIL